MKPPKVSVGIIFGQFEPDFVFSLLALKSWDMENRGHLSHPGWLIAQSGTNLPQQRNSVVRAFLDTDSEWLWFVDTDQRFRFDILDQLIDSADPVERPILSALVMAEKTNPYHRIVPACMGFSSLDPPEPREYTTIPPDKHWKVGAVGSGCVVIHRTVLEQMRDAHSKDAQPWFKYAQFEMPNPDTGELVPDIMGEDYVFSLRAAALGHPCHVDTEIEAGHIKKRTLTSTDFWPQVPPDQIPDKTFVIIPIKDNLKDTKALVHQLREQGGYSDVLILDNGSNPETRRWLESQTVAKIANAAGLGIHEMWNAGARWALSQHPRANLLFLNNDIRIGPNFCQTLRDALRSDEELVAVCPNYDGRTLVEDVAQLHGICADKYDGTGGLAGFAFMVKSELFAAGWQFPEDCKWWFGDNDLTLTIDQTGGWYGMAGGTTVEHLDGGGKTGKWDDPAMQSQLLADRAAFLAKWSAQGVQIR